MNRRLKLTALVFILSFILLFARLFYWQVLKADDLASTARRQHQLGQSTSARRGNILAADESWLAGRTDGWLMYASIPEIRDVDQIADKVAPLIMECEDGEDCHQAEVAEASRIKNILTKDGLVWVPIKKKLTTEVKNQIEAFKLPGTGFEAEDLREYPESSTAAQLLGFVGKDQDGIDQGYFGLEGYYDLVLKGKPGYITRDSDAVGSPIVIGSSRVADAAEGVDLVTYIDKGIQLQVESKLKEALTTYGASSGSVVVMDPKTGAVLAMASYPGFDPEKYSQYSEELYKNPVISDSFEPGSVFKVIVMASALDAGVVGPDTVCDQCSGPVKVDKYTINTWNNEYHPDSTMTDVIVHSDNVGMVYVAQQLGLDNLTTYLEKFRIGSLTQIDLQGEATPSIRDKDEWSVVDLATASFGQGIAVTPIQLIRATAAIANGGYLVTPRVVGKIRGAGWEVYLDPVVGERVISEEASRKMRAMMVDAARYGEAQWTHLKGFSVAGKTGTAQIPLAGHYDEEKTIASFIGFAPASDPKFIMLVSLREPQSSPWASETAAPLWYKIASDLFIHFKIQPER